MKTGEALICADRINIESDMRRWLFGLSKYDFRHWLSQQTKRASTRGLVALDTTIGGDDLYYATLLVSLLRQQGVRQESVLGFRSLPGHIFKWGMFFSYKNSTYIIVRSSDEDGGNAGYLLYNNSEI